MAPVGNDVERPTKLFLVLLQEFNFVKREGTDIKITIGDRKLSPARFPINREGKKVYFARYASKLAIGEINSAPHDLLVFEQTEGAFNQGIHNVVIDQSKKISEYWIEYSNEKIKLSFVEGFPNPMTLANNKKVKVHWHYDVSGTIITGGTYSLFRSNDLVKTEINVTKKWKPQNLPFNLRAFVFFVRSFRTWPTTYKWEGHINLKNLSLQGQWQRN